jgi:hypothetical protein
MKKIEARQIAELFASTAFKSGKNAAAAIKIVQARIALDPVADSVKKAEETARSKFLSEEMNALIEKSQAGELKADSEEGRRFARLAGAFEENFGKTLEPTYNADISADIRLPRLTRDEFAAVLEANGGFSGNVLGLIVENLVETGAEATVQEA